MSPMFNFSRRKSLTGNWKTNVGQSILEEVPIQERHKSWIDAVSAMFGGLTICSLEALVARDGREFIIEVNDCALGLLGESQEEDRKNIAEVVMEEMSVHCRPPQEARSETGGQERTEAEEPCITQAPSDSDSSDSESSTASDSSNPSPTLKNNGKGKSNPFNATNSGKVVFFIKLRG